MQPVRQHLSVSSKQNFELLDPEQRSYTTHRSLSNQLPPHIHSETHPYHFKGSTTHKHVCPHKPGHAHMYAHTHTYNHIQSHVQSHMKSHGSVNMHFTEHLTFMHILNSVLTSNRLADRFICAHTSFLCSAPFNTFIGRSSHLQRLPGAQS